MTLAQDCWDYGARQAGKSIQWAGGYDLGSEVFLSIAPHVYVSVPVSACLSVPFTQTLGQICRTRPLRRR